MAKYCYTAILYGNNEYFLGALMLGFSLSKIKSPHDKILMVTPEVPYNQRIILQDFFIIKEVPYVYINDNNFFEVDTSFRAVFTKLHLFKLTQYKKIIVMDLDMFVLHNMDHLFELPTPAANINIKLKQGQKIPSDLITIKNDMVRNGINTGVMLLEPSEKEFDNIIDELIEVLPYKLKDPEQDYLSYRYRNEWINIDSRYNCQFTNKEEMYSTNYTVQDIYNLHYWSIFKFKPWELVGKNKDRIMSLLINTGCDITYYTLWVQHYRILERMYEHKNIIIKDSYTYSNNYSKIEKI